MDSNKNTFLRSAFPPVPESFTDRIRETLDKAANKESISQRFMRFLKHPVCSISQLWHRR